MSPRLTEVTWLFFKLGAIGFGGPAVHIATMESELVDRRKWLTHEEFIDLVGATNLIPGPNSTEMAIHLGMRRAGFPGLFAAGFAFILPAATITLALAWLYVRFGQGPRFEPILAGIKPVVVAIVATAGWRLASKAVRSRAAGVLAAAAVVASLAGYREIPVLLFGTAIGFVYFAWRSGRDSNTVGKTAAMVSALPPSRTLAGIATFAATTPSAVAAPPTLLKLGLFFAKVGAILYGTGYVLIAYLQGELVDQTGWLTQEQLESAIAAGQLSPGPILSTSTFIGYVVMANVDGPWSGLAGALVATSCIFAPSFLFVAITGPIVPRLRKNRWSAAFLDAVNTVSIGLLAAVAIELARRALFVGGRWSQVNWLAVAIAGVALTLTLRWRVNPAWLVIGGGVIGMIWMAMRGG